MMGHRQIEQAALFYAFSLERHIPADHLLRSIDRFVELGELRRELARFYSSIGRPSIDPERGALTIQWGSHTTNLAVVAPGIAEALLATALGLAAAIPAVVIYNMFARQITSYRAALADTSAEVLRLVSRDLDHGFSIRKPTPTAAE